MIARRVRVFLKKQSGFTLIEVLVSLAIISLISLGVTMATGQIINQTSKNNDCTTATRQALNAVHWISEDAQMAQILVSDPGDSGFPLRLEWKKWDNSEHEVIYTLQNNKISRSYTVGVGGVPSTPVVTLIAEYVNEDTTLTNCLADNDNGVLYLKITSSVGEGDRIVDYTKEAEISARPHL
jgi:prepilin-type N-terminal cleavage/methylation domain-containing protein